MTVPYTFATQSGNIPLAALDDNFTAVDNNVSTANTVVFSAQPNITSVGTLISVSSSGNVTANYFIGNGAALTGVVATISYGNANVEAYLPTSPTIIGINANVANTDANVANLTLELANVATASSLANTNANVANLVIITTDTDSNVANLTATLGNTDSNVANLITITTDTDSNVANLTSDLANTNANVANLVTITTNTDSNVITLQGQVYANANVANYLPTYSGNITANNISAITAVQLPVYADSAARDTAIAVPVTGMFIINGTTPQIYTGATWGNITLS